MKIYSVRTIIDLSLSHYNDDSMPTRYLYEERLTMWKAGSATIAIRLAEKSDLNYCDDRDFRVADFAQSYRVDSKSPTEFEQGMEIFSLIRGSDLELEDYLDQFFDTGNESQDQV